MVLDATTSNYTINVPSTRGGPSSWPLSEASDFSLVITTLSLGMVQVSTCGGADWDTHL